MKDSHTRLFEYVLIVLDMISFSFENSSSSHTCSDTHGDDTEFLVGSLEFVKEGDNLSSTSHSQGVTKSDSTTSGVELLLGNSERLV